jgi:hypothetical protein
LLELFEHSLHDRGNNRRGLPAACAILTPLQASRQTSKFAANSAARMRSVHLRFDVLVLVCADALSRFELNSSLACRLVATVLEDLGRDKSQYFWPQHRHSDLHFFSSFCSILLKNCHRLRGSSGARHGSVLGPSQRLCGRFQQLRVSCTNRRPCSMCASRLTLGPIRQYYAWLSSAALVAELRARAPKLGPCG